MDKIQELKKLKALLDDEVISLSEFNSLKLDILSSNDSKNGNAQKIEPKETEM